MGMNIYDDNVTLRYEVSKVEDRIFNGTHYYLPIPLKEQEKNLENDQLVKYIDAATDAISKAVLTVNQTYVDSLKKQGKFDAEAAKTAKQMAIDKAKALITEDSKAAIETLYSDFEAYLNDAIEELVRENKVTY